MSDALDSKARFWGVIIATVLATTAGNLGVANSLFARDGDGEVAARVREKATADYINLNLRPQIEEAFAEVDDAIDGLDDRIASCIKTSREADLNAYAALRLAESTYGAARVARTIETVEAEEADNGPPPAPAAPRPRAAQKTIDPYELE